MISVKKALKKLCPIWYSFDNTSGSVKIGNLLIHYGTASITNNSGGSEYYYGDADITFDPPFAQLPFVATNLVYGITIPTSKTIAYGRTESGMKVRYIGTSKGNTRTVCWIAIGKA